MADVKITALPARSAVAATDVMPVVDAASGTPATQKATVAQVRAALVPIVLTTDVSGTLPVVNGGTGLAALGTGLQVLRTNAGATATEWATISAATPTGTGYYHVTAGAMDAAAVSLTWTGDATGTGTGTSFALTVVKVNGASVPAAGALTIGNAPYVSGLSALTYSALNLAGGSGWVTGVLPTANQAAQAMAGDVTGTTAAAVVAKINGTTVPAGGALTTGNTLGVTGVSAAAWSALNLAGGSGYVTGVLPVANQASQTMAGDVTGTTAAAVVAKINGATIPASGALTTGNAPYVSGVSALTYSALNLAGGSGWVTGVLPAANATQATGTGFPHVTGGVLDAASIKVDTTNAAHVVVPATAGGVITSSGTVLQQPSGITAGANWFGLSDGSTISTTGQFRGGAGVLFTHAVGGVDRNFIEATSGADLILGDPTNGGSIINRVPGGGLVYHQVGGNNMLTIDGTALQTGEPIIGLVGQNSPWSAHGKVVDATAPPFTVTAATYAYDAIRLSNAGAGTVTFPLPASDAAAYYKTIINSGNGLKTISNSGVSTVGVSANTSQRLLFDLAGVHPVAAAVAYP